MAVWNTSLLNNIMMAIAIILVLAYLRKFLWIFPHIVDGAIRWKNLIHLENNMSISRERDSLARVSIFISGLCISALDIFKADFISALSPGHKTLAIFGVIIAFIVIRAILGLLCPCIPVMTDTARTANRSAYSFLVILTSILLFLTIISSISIRCFSICHNIGTSCTVAVWLLFLLRKCQIITSSNGQFTAILYLCAMELLPAGLLAATMIYL